MKKIVTKTAAALSGILMLFAAVSAGPGLAAAMADLMGYMIYLSVFAAPVWYFSKKTKCNYGHYNKKMLS